MRLTFRLAKEARDHKWCSTAKVAGALLYVLLGAMVACQGSTENGKGQTHASLEDVSHLVRRYYARANPEVTVRVVEVAASEQIPGWKQGMLEWSTGGEPQKMPFLVSSDARYFIPGEIIDLTQDPLQAIMDKIVLEGRPQRGAADGDIVVVEYADFQCPFCRRAYHMVEKELLANYGDRIRFYYKHLPLKKLHPWAESAAMAAECAAEQSPEAFWQLYNSLFQGQKEITEKNFAAKVVSYAAKAGLNEADFKSCLRTQQTSDRVQADIAEATVVGVSSTPTFIVNGHRIVGAQPLEAFREVIEEARDKPQAPLSQTK